MIIIQCPAQKLEIQNLNQGQGFVMIKDQEIKIIQNYNKILHVINLDSWINNLEIIKSNIDQLNYKNQYQTMIHSFNSLQEEINNVVPHNNRNKRGLINIIGSGLKYLTGVMDSNDEEIIKRNLDLNNKNIHNVIKNINDQVEINENFNENINNITKHINYEQTNIKNQLNILTNSINKNTIQIDQMQHVFQIQYDIQLLKDQVKMVKQNILLSKIGVLGSDILTTKEIKKYNITIEKIQNIKDSVILYNNNIVFVLMIPNYTEQKYFRILVEPIPNRNNLEIYLPNKTFITNNNNLYEDTKTIILKKNLIIVDNSCNILKNYMNCTYRENQSVEIKQITNNIIITKNIPKTKIIHNCSRFEVYLQGNDLMKFENCVIRINEIIYENYVIEDNFVIPNFNNITIKNIVKTITMEELKLQQINNTKIIEEIHLKNTKHEIVTTCLIFVIVIKVIIIMFVIIFLKKKKSNKTKIECIKIENLNSAEQNPKEGGVKSKPPFAL